MKYKKLKYKIGKGAICKTKCPYNYPQKIGSASCKECTYNIKHLRSKNIVLCSYEYQKGKLKKVEEIKSYEILEKNVKDDIINNYLGKKIELKQEFNQSYKYDNGKLRWSLFLWDIAEHVVRTMNIGAIKYNPNSYKKVEPYKERYSDALMRHYREFQKGNVIDKDTGTPILSCLICDAMFLLEKILEENPNIDWEKLFQKSRKKWIKWREKQKK